MEPAGGDGGDRKRLLSASGLDSSADAGDPPAKAHRSAGPKKAFLMNSETNLSASVGESSVRILAGPPSRVSLRVPEQQPAEASEDQRTQQYQARAMSLRLQELKREVSTTEAKLKTAEERQREQDQTLATVNACWKQVRPRG